MGSSAGSSRTAGNVDLKAVGLAALRRLGGGIASDALMAGRIGAELFGGR
jgi:hypothetical protein